jgi:hypothetical protein
VSGFRGRALGNEEAAMQAGRNGWKLWQLALGAAIFGGATGGGLEFLNNPNSETFTTLIVYAALGALIGAVVWFVSFRKKA